MLGPTKPLRLDAPIAVSLEDLVFPCNSGACSRSSLLDASIMNRTAIRLFQQPLGSRVCCFLLRRPGYPADLRSRRFQLQQQGFGVESARVAAKRAVSADDAVARNDDRQRVGRAGGSDRTDRARIADNPGDFRITLGMSVSDLRQIALHRLSKSMRERVIERQVEISPGT